MNRLKLIGFLGFFLFAYPAHAQSTGSHLMREIQFSRAPGNVKIIQDQDIALTIDKHLRNEAKSGMWGFRIRIFSNSGAQARKEGEVIMANFLSHYPEVRADFRFDSPFYLLYVGDFRTYSEAMKFLKEIERYYPDAFIVRSKINYSNIKSTGP